MKRKMQEEEKGQYQSKGQRRKIVLTATENSNEKLLVKDIDCEKKCGSKAVYVIYTKSCKKKVTNGQTDRSPD